MKLIGQSLLISLFFFGTVALWGCQSKSNSKTDDHSEVVLGKLDLYDGWARPGAKGRASAAYLTISNGTASIDTLLSVSSDVAEKSEVHKSFQNNDGTVGMRPAGQQVIPDGDDLELKPGGLHIMLMNLKQDLSAGDSVTVSLTFSKVGQKSLKLPVKVQN